MNMSNPSQLVGLCSLYWNFCRELLPATPFSGFHCWPIGVFFYHSEISMFSKKKVYKHFRCWESNNRKSEWRYPPVNKHSNGKSPSWIGNTSSKVDFHRYVRLPACNLLFQDTATFHNRRGNPKPPTIFQWSNAWFLYPIFSCNDLESSNWNNQILPSLKLTWHLKITHWKRRFPLEPSFLGAMLVSGSVIRGCFEVPSMSYFDDSAHSTQGLLGWFFSWKHPNNLPRPPEKKKQSPTPSEKKKNAT